jgi:hypothetical protein
MRRTGPIVGLTAPDGRPRGRSCTVRGLPPGAFAPVEHLVPPARQPAPARARGATAMGWCEKSGAGDGDRTRDLRLGRPPLLPAELLPLVQAISARKRSRPMAVRTHDIALRDLGQDSIVSGTTDQRWDPGALLLGIAMVEVHRAGRVAAAAVRAGYVSDLIEHRRLTPPIRPPLVQPLGSAWDPMPNSSPVLCAAAEPVTIGADDVALGDLRKHAPSGHQHRAARHDVECLR